jgi:hypothetical protein
MEPTQHFLNLFIAILVSAMNESELKILDWPYRGDGYAKISATTEPPIS